MKSTLKVAVAKLGHGDESGNFGKLGHPKTTSLLICENETRHHANSNLDTPLDIFYGTALA